MRYQNKCIFNQNANLEWRFWATRATGLEGNPKSLRVMVQKSLWQLGSFVRPKQPINMTSELPHGPHAQKHIHACLQDQVNFLPASWISTGDSGLRLGICSAILRLFRAVALNVAMQPLAVLFICRELREISHSSLGTQPSQAPYIGWLTPVAHQVRLASCPSDEYAQANGCSPMGRCVA